MKRDHANQTTSEVGALESRRRFMDDKALDRYEDDEFVRAPFAQSIANSICARTESTSLVIGLYGEWGFGKTTVLNYLAQELGKKENVIVVPFNPWRFPDETSLTINFFECLADALQRRLKSLGAEVGKLLKKLGRLLPSVGVGVGVGVELEVNVSKPVEGIGEFLSDTNLEKQKERIDEILTQEQKRVVVFLDDIDRLAKPEIQTLFRVIKLLADFEYVTYVLAFDEDFVAEALSDQYGLATIETGRRFLQKIVQVPLHLPAINTLAMRTFCLARISETLSASKISLSVDQMRYFADAYRVGLEPSIKTPRMAKQFANAIGFSLPLLGEEIDPPSLMLLEGMRLVYPALYKVIRENHIAFVNASDADSKLSHAAQQHVKEIIVNAIQSMEWGRRQAAIDLVCMLFPKLGSVLSATTVAKSRMEIPRRQKSISSKIYFDRYFSYSIPKHDIADSSMLRLFNLAGTRGDKKEELASLVKELAGNGRDQLFIGKVSEMVEELNNEASQFALATAIASNSEYWGSGAQDTLELKVARSATVDVILKLITGLIRMELLRRERLAGRLALWPTGKMVVFQNASLKNLVVNTHLPFAMDLFHSYSDFLRQLVKEFQDEVDIDHHLSEIREGIAAGIRSQSEQAPIYRTYPNDALEIYEFWAHYGKASEVTKAFEKIVSSGTDNALDIVKKFLRPSAPGRKEPLQLGAEAPQAFDCVVKSDVIYKALKPRRRSYYPKESIDETLIREFQRLHRSLTSRPQIRKT